MKKATFVLMLVAVGVFVGMVLPAPPPAWQPKTQITFEGFVDSTTIPPVTNAWRVIPSHLGELAKGPPAMYALFETKDAPREPTAWHLLEISQQEGGKWKPAAPAFVRTVSGGLRFRVAVPVPTTNAPLRVVMELEQFQVALQMPPTGKVAQFFWELRKRWKQWRYPNDSRQWLPKGPLFRMTNEFNFAAGTNAVAGKGEAGR